MNQDTRQLPIRFPADVKAWLTDQAKLNASSQNSEVIRAVRERMSRTESDKSNQEEDQ
jgi:hypothetical protein